jgi:hypothetical protein
MDQSFRATGPSYRDARASDNRNTTTGAADYIHYFHIGTPLFYFLRVKHGRRDLPILRQQQSIGRDRAEQVLNIIIRNEVMPAVVEWPIRANAVADVRTIAVAAATDGLQIGERLEAATLNQPADT